MVIKNSDTNFLIDETLLWVDMFNKIQMGD